MVILIRTWKLYGDTDLPAINARMTETLTAD